MSKRTKLARAAMLLALLGGAGCANDVSGYYSCLSAPLDRSVPIVAGAPPARMPYRAGKNGTVGWVELELTIGRDGQVDHAEVLSAEPPGVFERAALRAVAKWRYCPLPETAPDYGHTFRRKISFGHD